VLFQVHPLAKENEGGVLTNKVMKQQWGGGGRRNWEKGKNGG